MFYMDLPALSFPSTVFLSQFSMIAFCRLSHDVPVKRLFGVQSGY